MTWDLPSPSGVSPWVTADFWCSDVPRPPLQCGHCERGDESVVFTNPPRQPRRFCILVLRGLSLKVNSRRRGRAAAISTRIA